MLDKLQSTDFLPYLNQIFCISLDNGRSIELELVRVEGAGHASQPGTRQPFALYFLGPPSQEYLVQQICRLEHEQMGALELFLVPLGPEGGRMRYEAIFN